MMWVPISGRGSQVAPTVSSTSQSSDNATATVQTVGHDKVLSNASTLAAGTRTGNSALQSQRVVNFTLKASTSTGVRYNVYRSSKQGGCLKTNSVNCQKITPSPVPSTKFTDSLFKQDSATSTLFKAVYLGGPESWPSNEAQAVISLRKH